MQLQKLFDRMRRLGKSQPVVGMNHRDFFALHMLCSHADSGGMRMGELARLLDVPLPTLSKSIQSLEERGYVERRTDPADRRNTLASATPEGIALEKKANDNAEYCMKELFSRFGEQETEEFVRLCTRLVDLAEEQMKEGKEREKC